MKTTYFLLASMVLCSYVSYSPSQIETKQMPKMNLTSFVFPAALGDVQKTIWNFRLKNSNSFKFEILRDSNQLLPGGTLTMESRQRYVDPQAERIFKKEINQNDFYFHSWGEPITFSPVYSINGKPLQYIASFHLHLTRVSKNSTKVEIRTYDSKVISGKKLSLHGLANLYSKTPSTTIEEYQLLRKIGHGLKIQGMPQLILPPNGIEKMTPISPFDSADLVILFKYGITEEQIAQFSSKLLHQTITKNSTLPLREGIYEILRFFPGLQEHEAIAITFCKESTPKQQEIIIASIRASPIVYKLERNTSLIDLNVPK